MKSSQILPLYVAKKFHILIPESTLCLNSEKPRNVVQSMSDQTLLLRKFTVSNPANDPYR